MFSKLQSVFANKATKKPLQMPPVMESPASDSNAPAISPAPFIGPQEFCRPRFNLLCRTEIKGSHDRWKVIDKMDGKLRELKVIHTAALKPDEKIQATHELAALEAVRDDRNFVALRGQWVEGNDSCQLTEHMPFSLDAARTQGPLDPGRVRLYAAHIVNCLEILHSKGIVHNDVKLPNVFLSVTGRPVLGGMGRAKILERILACDDDFYDFNVTAGAEGGYFQFGMAYNPDEFARDIRGLAKSMYKMTTGNRLRRNIYGQPIKQPGDRIPQPLWDLIKTIIDPNPSKLKTDIARVKAHPYFSSIDWAKITCPDAGTYNPAPVIAPKPQDPSAIVYSDLPDIECDWAMAYLKAKLKPSASAKPPPDLHRMTLDEAVCAYTPIGGVGAPRYFSSIEEEERMIGSSRADEWD